MTDLLNVIYRINDYYNNDSSFNIQAVEAKQIVTGEIGNSSQNTCSNYILHIDFTGTPARIVETVDSASVTTIRYEPIVEMRTVFTGDQCVNNAAKHYHRMTDMTASFSDMKLRYRGKFTDASTFFEASYLNRQQGDSAYLVYFYLTTEEEYMAGFDEILYAYLSNPNNPLTTRNITYNL